MEVSRRGFFASLAVAPLMQDVSFAELPTNELDDTKYRISALEVMERTDTILRGESGEEKVFPGIKIIKIALQNKDNNYITAELPLDPIVVENTPWLRNFHPITNNIVNEMDLVNTLGIRFL